MRDDEFNKLEKEFKKYNSNLKKELDKTEKHNPKFNTHDWHKFLHDNSIPHQHNTDLVHNRGKTWMN